MPYARAFVARFASMGWRSVVLAHANYSGPSAISGARVVPTFRRSYFETRDRRRPAVQRVWNAIRGARRILRAAGGVLDRLARLLEPPPLTGVIVRDRRWKLLEASLRRTAARVRRMALRGLLLLAALAVAAVVAAPYLVAYGWRFVFGRPATRSTLSDFTMRVNAAIDRERSAADLRILVPTATPAIVAEMLALAAIRRDPLPRVAFIFHEDPHLHEDWYRPLELQCLRERLAGSGWAPGMGFYATNARLAEAVSDVFGVEVTSIGDVFDPLYVDKLVRVADGTLGQGELEPREAEIFAELQAHKDAGCRLAVCPGAMRHDKGLDQLPGLLNAMGEGDTDFRLVVQAQREAAWTHDQVLEAGTYPRVDVIPGDLSERAYLRLLAVADIVLVPYDADIYRMRISRVYLEAALAGKPILLSRGMASESDRTHVAAQPVERWDQWTKAANSLLAEASGAEAERAAGRRDAGTWRAWWAVTDWLTAPAPRVRPAKPVLYVRPAWFASGSATVFDQHLHYFSQHRLPVVETIVEPDRAAALRERSWRRALRDRAGSPATITCWSSPRSGLVGIGRLLALGALRLCKGTYARQLAETLRLCPLPRAVILGGRRGFAFVFVNHYFHQPFVAAFEGRLPLWIESHDVQAKQMVTRQARNLLTGRREPFERLLADELSYLRKADVVGAISVEEAAFFRERLAEKGNCVILCQPYVPRPPRVAANEAIDVLIVASDNPTNVMNLRWFIAKVMPTLPPGLRVRVVGTVGRVAARAGIESDRVEYVGPVRCLAPHYAAAKVVALPIVAGAGIAIKTLEAMAAGKAIVGTPLAFRGLPDGFAPPLPAEAEPARFARAIVRLVTDPAALAAAEAATVLANGRLELERRFAEQMSRAVQRIVRLRDAATDAGGRGVHGRKQANC